MFHPEEGEYVPSKGRFLQELHGFVISQKAAFVNGGNSASRVFHEDCADAAEKINCVP
jgi:hypothetical protein